MLRRLPSHIWSHAPLPSPRVSLDGCRKLTVVWAALARGIDERSGIWRADVALASWSVRREESIERSYEQ